MNIKPKSFMSFAKKGLVVIAIIFAIVAVIVSPMALFVLSFDRYDLSITHPNYGQGWGIASIDLSGSIGGTDDVMSKHDVVFEIYAVRTEWDGDYDPAVYIRTIDPLMGTNQQSYHFSGIDITEFVQNMADVLFRTPMQLILWRILVLAAFA